MACHTDGRGHNVRVGRHLTHGAGEERFERGDLFAMMKAKRMYAVLFAATWLGSVHAQSLKYPPIEEYLMPQANEIALAKSAAPANNFAASYHQGAHEVGVRSRAEGR